MRYLGVGGLVVVALLSSSAAARADESRWQSATEAGWRALGEGKEGLARQNLVKALQEAEPFPPGDARRALTHSYLAYVEFKLRDRAEADRNAKEALAVYNALSVDEAPAHAAKGLNALALLYQGYGDFRKADGLYKKATACEEKARGPNGIGLARLLGNHAALYEAQARYEEAEALRKRQVEMLDVPGDAARVPQAAIARQEAGHLYRLWNRDAQAEPHFLRAVELRRGLGKADDPDLPRALADLGRLYVSLGQYDRADPLLTEALQLREKAYGAKSVKAQTELAASLHDLGMLELGRGRYDRAEPLLNRALAIREKAAPEGDITTAATLHSLGTLHAAQKQYPRAEVAFKRAVQLKGKLLGASHLDVAPTAEAVADVYVHVNQSKEAERYFLRALSIREGALGDGHLSVAATRHALANFYRGSQRYADAEPLYKSALAAKEKALGSEHLALAALLDDYAQLLGETKRAEEGGKLKMRANAIRAKSSGAG
jgi:Tetratricopeptide repeat